MKDLINIKLEEIRKENKLTRKDLSNISGFKERTIGSYERGENQPSNEYIEFISLYFGYKKEYIEGKINKDINKNGWDTNLDLGTLALLQYQSIYNLTNKQIAKKLNISIKEYEEILQSDFIHNYETSFRFEIAEKLNIRPSCFWVNVEYFERDIKNELNINDINILFEYKRRLGILEVKGLAISKEYYASIIKQRNQPEIITPDTQKESIPDKYKEILELLPYASDSFTQNLKNKLLELKKAQQIEDL